MQSKINEVVAGTSYYSLTLTGNYSFIKTKEGRRMVVEARCKCGGIKNYPLRFLKTGNTKTCGCDRIKKFLTFVKVTHNLSKHPLYSVYRGMRERCYNERSISFKYYGAKGIKLCGEWESDVRAFCEWGMANGYQKGLEIDRKDNDGNYEPENCRFVTRAVGNTNTSRVIKISAFGEVKIVSEWTRDKRCSVSEHTLAKRFLSGMWVNEDAITSLSNSRKKEFCRNSASAKKMTAWGEEKSLIEWSEDERCKVTYSGLKERLRRGWGIEKAVSYPHRITIIH